MRVVRDRLRIANRSHDFTAFETNRQGDGE